jgi:prepilin-type N-terminal cleavage/methylation domain-containing protein/prepilin-type processing-associated H-X9-DG protein
MSAAHKRRDAYTLVELLVVIAIIGILMALLLPAVQKIRESANRITCANNLRQLALAAHAYHDERGSLPPGVVIVNTTGGRFAGGTNLWVELLPYLEQGNLYNRWDYNDYRNNVAGGTDTTTARVLKLFLCPSDALINYVFSLQLDDPFAWASGFYGLSSYGGNSGTVSGGGGDFSASLDGVFFRNSRVRLTDIKDGTSNTFLFGERFHRDPQFDRLTLALDPSFYPLAGWGCWASCWHPLGSLGDVLLGTLAPINYLVPPNSNDSDFSWEDFRLNAFGSGHSHGANFAFADGTVRFVTEHISLPMLQAASTRDGGEVADVP